MAIVRTYVCNDCGTRFDKLHFDRSEGPPECPGCQAISAKQQQVPAGFSIPGKVGKAADICYDIASRDYGMTNMRDNLREGDIAAAPLPAKLAEASQNFFQGGGPVISMARAGARAAAAEGRNPFNIVQSAAKSKGSSRVLCNPVNRVR